MKLKGKLREIAFGSGMDYFGVGPVERWNNAPKDIAHGISCQKPNLSL